LTPLDEPLAATRTTAPTPIASTAAHASSNRIRQAL
jgi:hypothetical protein